MRLDPSGPEVIEAVKNAVAWFDKVKIIGKERVKKVLPDGSIDFAIVDNPDAPPQWPRFYYCGTLGPWRLGVPEIKINQPIFVDTGRKRGFAGAGLVYDTMAAISRERRTGYNWMGPCANDLLRKDYPAWREKWLSWKAKALSPSRSTPSR